MRGLSFALSSGIAWLAVPPLCEAVAVEVTVVWHGAEEESPTHLEVKAIPVDEHLAEVELELGSGLTGSTELSPGVWRFEVRGEKTWSPKETLFVGDGEESVDLEVHPTGLVRGQLELFDKGVPRPESVSVRFRGSPDPDQNETGEPAIDDTVDCAVSEDGWSCLVPAGEHELRVRASSFVSHFFWGQKVRPGQPLDLGTLKLRRGASVVGVVATEDGAPLPERLEIELIPRAAGPVGPDEARRLAALGASAPLEERGFFHVCGIAPGSYEARVEVPGYVPVRTTPIQVVENSETELGEPLLLVRPLRLTVTVEPPLDLEGERWRFLLIDLASAEPVAEGVGDETGRFVFDGLRPGELMLDVSDGRRDSVATETIWLEPPGLEHRVVLDRVEVEGRLRLGEEPIACGLNFRGTAGGGKVAMESDEEGLFTGVLPRSGDWSIDIRCAEPPVFRRLWTVEVEPVAGGGPAWVELDLPDTWVEGEVVDHHGEPVSGAGVLAVQESLEERPFFTRTDEDGAFTFRGVAEGRYHLQARVEAGRGSALESERVLVESAENQSQAFHRLTLLGRKLLRGTVSSSAGPVAGVELTARPRDVQAMFVPKARTGFDGRFELSLIEGTNHLELTIMAPGFLLYRRELSIEGQDVLDVTLAQSGGGELVFSGLPTERGSTFVGTTVEIRHDGEVTYHRSTLSRWAAMNGVRAAPGRLIVPNMPTGSYEICSSRRLDGKKRTKCPNGFLTPGGRLELSSGEASADE